MTHTRIAICSALAIFGGFAAVIAIAPYLPGSEIIAPTPSAAGSSANLADNAGAVSAVSAQRNYCSFYGERWERELSRSLDAGKGRIRTTAGFGDRYEATVRLIRKYSRVDEHKQTIKLANVRNAAYLGSGKKKGEVLFNNNFLQSLLAFIVREGAGTGQAGLGGIRTDWPVVSVFAHMVGHYVAQHDLKKGAQPFQELQADWFTGYILNRMGADPRNSVYMIERFGPVQGSGTHPSRADRAAAVQAGYTYACDEKDDCQASQLDFQFNFPRAPQNMKATPNWPPKFDQVCTISGEQILIDRKYGFVFLRKLLTNPAMARANGTIFPVTLPSDDNGSRDAAADSCRFNIAAEEIGLVCVRSNGDVFSDATSYLRIGRCQSCKTLGLCPRFDQPAQ